MIEARPISACETVQCEILDAALARLGFKGHVPRTVDGLQRVFQAWCRGTGYDNLGLALRTAEGGRGPVPGFPAEDYLIRWLTHGMSNLCFGNSEALRALLRHIGFEAERVRGSMGSEAVLGFYKHGSVVVRIAGVTYLVDPTFLAEHPLPLIPGHRSTAGVRPLRIWADVDGTILWQIPQGRFNATFKIEETGCDFATFHEEHEKTKEGLAYGRLYKHKLFVRRNVEGGTRTYHDGKIITKSGSNFAIKKVTADEIAKTLVRDFGLSEAIVSQIPPSYLETIDLRNGARPRPS